MALSGYNFTESLRRALASARNEAMALHHEYVGTEHTLLGMLTLNECLGTIVVREFGADPADVADRIKTTVRPGTSNRGRGPDLPYTSRAKKVLELAMQEARTFNHSYVGTEHLLLGLLAEEKGIAAQVLQSFGINLQAARQKVLEILGTEIAPVSEGSVVRRPGVPPSNEKPASVGLILRYSNGAVVTKHFATVPEAVNFLSAQ